MSCKVSNTTNTYSNKIMSHGETVALSLWNSLRSPHPTNWVWRVTWKLAHFLSDVTGSSTVKSVTIFRYSSFVMCIRTAIYGSFPVRFPIDIQNPHHYWNVVYRQHRFLRRLFYWNIATGLNYCNGRLILRLNVQINFNEYFHATYFLEHAECLSHCAITWITTRRNGGRIVAVGPGLVADAEKKKSFFHSD